MVLLTQAAVKAKVKKVMMEEAVREAEHSWAGESLKVLFKIKI